MQYMAWAVLFLITVWQLFRVFGGPITEAENPWQLLLRSALFALLVGAARPIFTMALDIARAPYTALMEVSLEAEDFTFAGIEEALKNGLTTIVSTVSIVGPILILILLIALGWNYFKLLLECVERYIVVGVLCYTSPLAYATTGHLSRTLCRVLSSRSPQWMEASVRRAASRSATPMAPAPSSLTPPGTLLPVAITRFMRTPKENSGTPSMENPRLSASRCTKTARRSMRRAS